eukprot:c10200_g1_i1.p1 GENE.c10200_g1_i1~~c10200_g1_i1.p1  ORF type:complete len:836 (-),score=200.47 c10200_g1_i1:53-2560(-)
MGFHCHVIEPMSHTRGVVLLVLCVCPSAWGLINDALTPNLDELGMTLTQVISSIGSQSALEMQERYKQVVKAEEIFLSIMKQINADQATDDQLTATAQSALAGDVAALDISLERNSHTQQHHQEVIARLSKSIEGFQKSMESLNGSIAEQTEVLSRTRSECQSIKDYHNARTETLRNDISVLSQLTEMVSETECESVNNLLQTVASATSLEKISKEVGCDCNVLVQTESPSPAQTACPCNNPSPSNTLAHQDIRYNCETRKTHVIQLLDDLKAELYSSVSQDTHALDESLNACKSDLALQQASLNDMITKAETIRNDILGMENQKLDLIREATTIETSLHITRELLAIAHRKQSNTACRHDKRTQMRKSQRDTLAALLDTLNQLSNSTYSDHHLELTSDCPNECSGHGSCFLRTCRCDDGWSAFDCSLSISKECPFNPHSPPCTEHSCFAVDFANLPESSECTAVVCNHCRSNITQAGCYNPSTAMLCAAFDRRTECTGVCPAMPDKSVACGLKREVREPFTGCCFHPMLDCADKCSAVICPDTEASCPAGLAVRYPIRGCCFDSKIDCVDRCSVVTCENTEPSCPEGKRVRKPYAGCCFDENLDCEDNCSLAVCDQDQLPSDVCRSKGLRWSGGTVGCCFNADIDCISGDNPNQTGERLALTSLFQSAGGSEWVRGSHWGSSVWICYWDGVECSSDSGEFRVVSLSLPANGLKGTLPPELKQLTYLEVLDLSENQLEGAIPDELTALTHLHTIRLKQNFLTGEVSQGFAALPKLEIFDISRTLVTGKLPDMGHTLVGCDLTCLCDNICSPRLTPDSLFNPRSVICEPCPGNSHL